MKLVSLNLKFLFLNILINCAKGYKILGVFPIASKSHDLFCQSVAKALAKRGHQMDVIVTQELENPPENYTVIFNMVEIVPIVMNDKKVDELVSIFSDDPVNFFSHYGNLFCELIGNEKIQEILKKLKTESKYDLFLVEAHAVNCFMGFAYFLKIPMVTLSPQTLHSWVEETIGNPTSVATHPNLFSPLLEINSFWDRLQNTMENIFKRNKFYYHTDATQTHLIRKYISPDLPNVRELAKSSILTLINTHFSFNGIRPSTPALIEVGGLHILQDETTFTPEMQTWMDESEDGVVYFSLGTIVIVDSLPKKTILAIYSVIEKLKPVRFLIRVLNANNLPHGAPENLKTLQWIPQIPVLSHKNTKAFISHCGLLSSQEALYFGVPVIGIPLFFDQFVNANIFVKKNMGLKLNLNNISEKIFLEALTLILNNSSYREAARRASILFKDRPMNAEDTTVYWVEYVIRNGGILKSPAVDLHWIQRELLDVYGFLLLSTILILYLITKIIKAIVIFKFQKKPAK